VSLRDLKPRGPGGGASGTPGGGPLFDRHVRIIRGILSKDLSDALRDSRVIIPLLVPLGLGLFYSFMFEDAPPRTEVTVAYVTQGATELPREVKTMAGDAIDLKQRDVADVDELRRLVAEGDVDVGVVVPAGFDDDARAGHSPKLQLFVSSEASTEGDLGASVVERAAVKIAARPPTVDVTVQPVEPEERSALATLNALGLRAYEVLLMVVLLLAMVGASVIPTVLSDETQTRTLDALLMVASYSDVIVAKALFGFIFSVAGVPILLSITRLWPEDTVAFSGVVVLSALVLVGIGLLMGSFVKTQGQLSVWSNIAFLPLLGAAVATTLDLPTAAQAVLAIIPTTHTTRLAANCFAGEQLFSWAALSWVILAAWTVAIYAALWWRLRRMDA